MWSGWKSKRLLYSTAVNRKNTTTTKRDNLLFFKW